MSSWLQNLCIIEGKKIFLQDGDFTSKDYLVFWSKVGGPGLEKQQEFCCRKLSPALLWIGTTAKHVNYVFFFSKIILDLSRTYTQDGVCLTESGLCQLQSLSATASRRRKPKPKLKLKIINQNSVAVLQAPVDPVSEHSRDEDMEDNRGICLLAQTSSFISDCL